MRTIDADSFADRMYREAFEKDSDDQKWDSGCWIRYKMFERVLREAPTIELERETGRWRHYEGCLTCSECGIEYYDDIMEYCGDDVPRFCPNCGADMREDAEELKKCDTCQHEKEPWSMQCHRCEDFNLWEEKQ